MLDSPRGPVFLDFDDPGNGELRISRHDLVGIGGAIGSTICSGVLRVATPEKKWAQATAKTETY